MWSNSSLLPYHQPTVFDTYIIIMSCVSHEIIYGDVANKAAYRWTLLMDYGKQTLLPFIFLPKMFTFLQYLCWSVQDGSCSSWQITLCLQCIDATLAHGAIWQLLAQADHTNYVSTMVAAVHLGVAYLIAPPPFPRCALYTKNYCYFR